MYVDLKHYRADLKETSCTYRLSGRAGCENMHVARITMHRPNTTHPSVSLFLFSHLSRGALCRAVQFFRLCFCHCMWPSFQKIIIFSWKARSGPKGSYDKKCVFIFFNSMTSDSLLKMHSHRRSAKRILTFE